MRAAISAWLSFSARAFLSYSSCVIRRDAVFELGEASDVTPWSGETFDYSETDWIDRLRKHNRHAMARLQQRRYRNPGSG
jgi:hypothetical protein